MCHHIIIPTNDDSKINSGASSETNSDDDTLTNDNLYIMNQARQSRELFSKVRHHHHDCLLYMP